MSAPYEAPHDLFERCQENFIEGSWQLQKDVPGAKMEKWPDATAIKCDIPSPVVNILFALRGQVNAEEILAHARSFFGKQTPWRVVTSNESKETFRPIVESKEFQMVLTKPMGYGGTTGMILPSIPQNVPANPDSIMIKQVSNSRELNDFYSAVRSSFGIPVFILRRTWPRVPESTPEAPTIFFVGYSGEDKKPVASSTLIASHKIAGIFSVGTRKDFRNKGYGTAMTWAAIRAGRDLGLGTSYLAATGMGFPIYQKMGFRRVTDYPEWNNPVPNIAKIRSILSILSFAFR